MSLTLTRSRLCSLLGDASDRRIAIVGDAMLDVYLRGDVDRISPEAPVPVVRVRERRFALGGAANVAQNVAALGAACELVATVGADLGAAEAERVLAAARRAVGDADALILEDYNKGVLVPSVIEQVTRWARDTGVPVVVDPKYRHFFAYRGATVFKPNRRELEAALGASVDLEHPEAIPAALQR